MTAGNNDDIASPYQELQNVRPRLWWRCRCAVDWHHYTVTFDAQTCIFLLSPDRLSFLTMLPSIWEEFAIKFERRYNKRAANVRALTSETHNQIFLHRWDDATGLHLITIFGRSLSDCVYLVPREIDHIPACSVRPRLLAEEHGRMFHWLCHRLPNANHNTSDCSAC